MVHSVVANLVSFNCQSFSGFQNEAIFMISSFFVQKFYQKLIEREFFQLCGGMLSRCLQGLQIWNPNMIAQTSGFREIEFCIYFFKFKKLDVKNERNLKFSTLWWIAVMVNSELQVTPLNRGASCGLRDMAFFSFISKQFQMKKKAILNFSIL